MHKMYGVPVDMPPSIRSDAGGECTVQSLKHQCQGLRRSIDYGPTNQTQSQGAVEMSEGYCRALISLGHFGKTST